MPARILPAVFHVDDRGPITSSASTSTQTSQPYPAYHLPAQQLDIPGPRLQDNYVLYDTTAPPPFMAIDNQRDPYPTLDHPSRYPPPFIPTPPVQVNTYPIPQTRPNPGYFLRPNPPPSFVQVNGFPAGSIPPANWSTQPPPPLFAPPGLPPPPPIPHKVWILDCKSCDMFLTNRGMKAVLLLRPNVPLYSTDAMPINCSAYSDAGDVTPISPVHTPSRSPGSSQGTSSPNSIEGERTRILTRTCECLTQTLHCHGCGNAVGYMIVTPCHRCMSSITATNRTTNGHRFVFYSSEIVASERHYIPGEIGVRPFIPPPPSSLPPPPPLSVISGGVTLTIPPLISHRAPPMQRTVAFPPERPMLPPFIDITDREDVLSEPRRTSPSTDTSSSSSPIEFSRPPVGNNISHLSGPGVPPLGTSPPPSTTHPLPPLHVILGGHPAQPSPPRSANGVVTGSIPETLKAGDIVYWQHLVRSGEIPAVVEDDRARRPRDLHPEDKKGSLHGGKKQRITKTRQISGLSRGIVAGR